MGTVSWYGGFRPIAKHRVTVCSLSQHHRQTAVPKDLLHEPRTAFRGQNPKFNENEQVGRPEDQCGLSIAAVPWSQKTSNEC